MTENRRRYEALIQYGLALPEAWEDHPWGEIALKVRKKVFLFSHYSEEKDRFTLSLKLPASGAAALQRPGAAPTGYGLGKSGWVSLGFGAGDGMEMGELCAWIDESYLAVAPKSLGARLG